mgnify:CR=1 FL=1
MTAESIKQLISTLLSLRERYEKFEPATFFVAGFGFDVLTLGRVDDLFSILQQSVFLLVLAWMLQLSFLVARVDGASPPKWFFKAWPYKDEIIHFLLGSLLSLYALFFFVSSSLAVSLWFLAVMFILLLLNEYFAVKGSRHYLTVGLFSLCVFSYLFYLIPVLTGSIAAWTFFLALFIGLLVMSGLAYLSYRRFNERPVVVTNVMAPAGAVAAFMVLLYFAKILPPVPLAMKSVGIYRSVEVKGGEYHFGYQRSPWKFWQKGDQHFEAAPGDQIYCFAALFAPGGLKGQVIFEWQLYQRDQWIVQDRIPIQVVGGRAQGYRGYVRKSNYQPGQWRVLVKTPDGREVGRIGFEVETLAAADVPEVREQRYDVF